MQIYSGNLIENLMQAVDQVLLRQCDFCCTEYEFGDSDAADPEHYCSNTCEKLEEKAFVRSLYER